MSLLLDALKRAEQAKQAKQPGHAEGDIPPPVPRADPVPEAPHASAAPMELALVESPFERSRPSADAAEPAVAESRDAARNVFAAKQTRNEATSSRPWLLPAIAAVVVVVGAGGWYVWTEMSRVSRPPLARAPAVSAPITQVPQQPAASVPTTAPATAPAGGGTSPSQAPQVFQTAEAPLPDRVASVKPAAAEAERARDSLIRTLKDARSGRDAPVSLRLSKGIEPPRVSADLAGAYSALKAADYTQAKRLYASVIESDSLNIDARLGMAAAQARTGDRQAAAREYRKALEIDPRNPNALAGLLIVSDQSGFGPLETELKTLMAKNPDSPALAFALGNLYAAQNRWTEAQQAYFDAYRHEPDNADYTHNLAVSLDQLKQSRLALDYYQRALAAVGKSGGQFDRSQAARRVNELKSAN